MDKLSKRQKDILNFIIETVMGKGYPPSVREIGEAVGLASSSTVHGHLERLERKGYIRRDPEKPRAIEITTDDFTYGQDESVKKVPLLGRVTAGVPITAYENIEDYFPLPRQIVKSDQVFMLRVIGDSMIEAGIFDGDLIIIRQQNTANNGEIVVAMTEEDEATVKRFYKEKARFRLEPENSAMEPIIVDNITILGKVIGLYRDIH